MSPTIKTAAAPGTAFMSACISPDHRQKIFRSLPQMAWGGELFSSDIMWWIGDWIRLDGICDW
jgi:hypothetical protein